MLNSLSLSSFFSRQKVMAFLVITFSQTAVTNIYFGIIFLYVVFKSSHRFFSLYTSGSQFQSSRPPPPRSAYFVCYSYRFRCLFYSNVSALRSGQHRIFRHNSSSKQTYIFHSKCSEVCKTWIKIVYIYRGIWCHTRPCVKTLRSANPWMNVPK